MQSDANPYDPPRDYGAWISSPVFRQRPALTVWSLLVCYVSLGIFQGAQVLCLMVGLYSGPWGGVYFYTVLTVGWLSVFAGLIALVLCLLYGNFAIRLLSIVPAFFHVQHAIWFLAPFLNRLFATALRTVAG